MAVAGNCWRYLAQIWHRVSTHPKEGYRLCDYVVDVAWAWIGVAGNCWRYLDQIWHGRGWAWLANGEGIWTQFGMDVPHTSRKVTSYVAMWWAWHGRGWA